MEHLLNSYFCYNYFTLNFLNRYFSELPSLVGDRKINKMHQRKVKPGVRLWALGIIHWKLRLYGKLFCIRQTSQLSVLPCITSLHVCFTDKYLQKLPLINSEANLRPPQHLKWNFFDIS